MDNLFLVGITYGKVDSLGIRTLSPGHLMAWCPWAQSPLNFTFFCLQGSLTAGLGSCPSAYPGQDPALVSTQQTNIKALSTTSPDSYVTGMAFKNEEEQKLKSWFFCGGCGGIVCSLVLKRVMITMTGVGQKTHECGHLGDVFWKNGREVTSNRVMSSVSKVRAAMCVLSSVIGQLQPTEPWKS